MLRMETALFLIIAMIAWFYFSSPRIHSPLHDTYSILLITVLLHLFSDGITVYTVANLDTVPLFLNNLVHRVFIGTMIIVEYLFYRYISELIREDTGIPSRMEKAAFIMLCIFEAGVLLLPIHYAVTPEGNYSDGIHANLCYIGVGFYLILCVVKMLRYHRHIRTVSSSAICAALFIELMAALIQGAHPAWLISGMGITLVTLTFYLTLENPEKLRAELNEQKMSMLYLKSQVNPHFLYNTLDSIRIQAQLNHDDTTAHLLMRLVDFFRLNVRSNDQEVTLEHETELIDAYMELMCYRYPELKYECEVDEDLLSCMVPNFILQPLVENSLLHGLKHKGYRGSVSIMAEKKNDTDVEIIISDTGKGFDEEEKKRVETALAQAYRFKEKNTGNHIGITNVQNRIRLLCGNEYGLRYTDNPDGGVSVHILLPYKEESL